MWLLVAKAGNGLGWQLYLLAGTFTRFMEGQEYIQK
jgi:hypothetical protein